MTSAKIPAAFTQLQSPPAAQWSTGCTTAKQFEGFFGSARGKPSVEIFETKTKMMVIRLWKIGGMVKGE